VLALDFSGARGGCLCLHGGNLRCVCCRRPLIAAVVGKCVCASQQQNRCQRANQPACGACEQAHAIFPCVGNPDAQSSARSVRLASPLSRRRTTPGTTCPPALFHAVCASHASRHLPCFAKPMALELTMPPTPKL